MLGQQLPHSEIGLEQSSLRKKSLIGVFLILISVLFYVLFLRPISSEVSVLKADVASKTSELEQLKGKMGEVKDAEQKLKVTTEVERQQSLQAVPSNINQDEVIRDLIDIAAAYDIALRSLSFGKGTASATGINSLRINASFEGNYTDLLSFLEGIEHNGRFLRVESISAQINKVEVFDIDRVTFSLSIEAFFQKQS